MVVPEAVDGECALAFHASAPIIEIAFMIDSPMLAFNEITDFLTNVFKAAAFSCVIIILIVICVVLLVLNGLFLLIIRKMIHQKTKLRISSHHYISPSDSVAFGISSYLILSTGLNSNPTSTR